jgi:ribonuclease HII
LRSFHPSHSTNFEDLFDLTTDNFDSYLERLLAKSIAELREMIFERGANVPQGLIEALEADSRRGARQLAQKIRERRRRNRSEGQRLNRLQRFERELQTEGYTLIAGVDEAGMAPLAGPVVAGAVILRSGYKLRGLDDSKKILDETKRDELAEAIKSEAICWATGQADVEEIDSLNIYHAGLLAMKRAVFALTVAPEFILVDARTIPSCTTPQRGIIHGDALSANIAAASIVAKTTRDHLMRQFDEQYPGYGFAIHKGYPTPEHCRRLRELGPVPIHRRSFARVRACLPGPLFENIVADGQLAEENSMTALHVSLDPSASTDPETLH